uniref:non-specific serine/threonine protein kinase n=1 Tax=Oryza rufipogon TaxID=4529 RepID=A0A0E0RAS4_ORYRU
MVDELQHTDAMPTDLTFDLIKSITDDFSEKNQIGHGGYGIVYKGVLENGKEVAGKKLHDIASLDDVKFMNEFINLMSAQHQNIVQLVGYCYDTRRKVVLHNGKYVVVHVEERALCFEYLQRGSLDKYLSDESSGFDWCTRYKIIKGICEGVNYLHNRRQDHIYHLDLKPGNILLDKNNIPKIADFGLSRLFCDTLTCHTTKKYIGTVGYMPPEYIQICHITEKFDVFSLGVIIIEIMTGTKETSKRADMSPQQFIELVHENWRRRFELATPMYTSEEVESLRLQALTKFGPWGGSGDMDRDMEVVPHRLESLTICSADIINSLAFSYNDHNGKQHTVGPWGGDGGAAFTIRLGAFEHIKGLSGTVGSFGMLQNVITSLKFTTNLNRTYGPYGKGGGTPFVVPVEDAASIVGFFGRAGPCVEALGVYIRTYL